MAVARKNRLTKKKDFDLVFKEGNAIKAPFLFIKYRKTDRLTPRFGFMIPIKITGNTVIRNRLKRVLSENIRQHISKSQKGYDVVVMVRKLGEEDALRAELDKFFEANIWRR